MFSILITLIMIGGSQDTPTISQVQFGSYSDSKICQAVASALISNTLPNLQWGQYQKVRSAECLRSSTP
jgi:hypothetical protein